MDCLYTAWADYMRWLGHQPDKLDLACYRILKVGTHGPTPQPTFGGVIPWILDRLGRRYGYTVRGEWRIYSPRMYAKVAPNRTTRNIVKYMPRHRFGWEVQQITLAPAVYLDLGHQHAFFAEQVPDKGCIIAAYTYV